MTDLLITFAGIDGCGKSTQANLLYNYFTSIGYKTNVFSGYKNGSNINELKHIAEIINSNYEDVFSNTLISQSLFYDLFYNLNNIYLPALKNSTVILERYYWDSVVYSEVLCKSKILKQFITSSMNIYRMPDFQILLTIEPKIAYDRLLARNKLPTAKEKLMVMALAQEKYIEYFSNLSNSSIIHCEDKSEVDIQDEIQRAISSFIKDHY